MTPAGRRALLIRNPVARHAIDKATLERVIDVAVAAGWQIETIATEHAGHGTELARAAAESSIDVIVVHGGDGTVNEVINGAAGTDAAVAVLRGGTANVWAKETQCAKDPVASMRAIVTGRRRRVDLGRANGRYFLLMAGVGLDAMIVPRVGSRMKRRFGAAAYIIAGVIAAFRTRAWRVEMTIDAVPAAEGSQTPSPPVEGSQAPPPATRPERSLYWLLAGNTRSYGGVVSITHRAIADDGLLDIVLMRRGGPLRLVADGVRLLLRRHDRSPNIRYVRARSVTITTPGISIQLDGELHGETPLTIEVAPLALNVIVPADLTSPLFTVD